MNIVEQKAQNKSPYHFTPIHMLTNGVTNSRFALKMCSYVFGSILFVNFWLRPVFLSMHTHVVLKILWFVLCMSFACKCMYATAFIQRWQAVLNQVVFLTPDSQPLSFSLALPCVLIRLGDVKPRLSFEAIHTLHSNNVLLLCAPSTVSPSFLTFLNLTSPHLHIQKPGLIQNSTLAFLALQFFSFSL